MGEVIQAGLCPEQKIKRTSAIRHCSVNSVVVFRCSEADGRARTAIEWFAKLSPIVGLIPAYTFGLTFVDSRALDIRCCRTLHLP